MNIKDIIPESANASRFGREMNIDIDDREPKGPVPGAYGKDKEGMSYAKANHGGPKPEFRGDRETDRNRLKMRTGTGIGTKLVEINQPSEYPQGKMELPTDSVEPEFNQNSFPQPTDEPDPYVITQGVPRSWGNWRPKDASGAPIQATFITLKTTEPRGAPMEVIRSMAYQSTGRSGATIGPFKSSGIMGVYSPSGHSIQAAMKKAGWAGLKITGLAFAFSPNIDGPTAELALENLVSAFRSKQDRVAKQREKYRADAPKRAKAAAAARSHGDKAKRQALYDKYGKKNVLSVTARQIGGDDGGQWNVLINGIPMVNGLTHSEVPYYKKQAYEILLKRNGKY